MIAYSIIIPHYNIPDLLSRCLDSIPQREDVQIIVVDDCSTDAESWSTKLPALKRPDVEFYSTQEGGCAGRARNVGLKYAKGHWLVFADADDFFEENFSETLDKYRDEKADIVYFHSRSVDSDDITQRAFRTNYQDRLWKAYHETGDVEKVRFHIPVVWGKFYRREFIVDIGLTFEEVRYSNDYFFSVCADCKAQKLILDDAPLYVATARSGSLAYQMNTKPGELEMRAEVCFRAQRLILEHGFSYRNADHLIEYMKRLFDNGKRELYYHYFREIGKIGFSRLEALRMLCQKEGRRKKLQIYLLSLLHLCL